MVLRRVTNDNKLDTSETHIWASHFITDVVLFW